ncbi:MAG: phage terminase large subunit family protein, partial [Eubacteriales bacterium]|nr:phage terminase large subunit family protein [Eubacteriales bacterium]
GFMVGVDSGKEAILHATSIENPDGLIPCPKYMHFPKDTRCGYDEEYFQGLISEQMVIHRSHGNSTIAFEKIHDRNEPLDCRNYARAAYRYFNWNFDKLEETLLEKRAEAPKPQTQAQAEKKKPRHMISRGIQI